MKIITALAFLSATLPLLAPGCGGKDEYNVGYYYVQIPGFHEADYLPMLGSSDLQIQYNAICYFTEGGDYDRYLTVDSLKKTPKHDTALLLYQKIYPLMESENSWVGSAAIRFIGQFEYNRAAYQDFILKNTNPDLNIQLEIINNLINDSVQNRSLYNQKIGFLLQHSSWLLHNAAYLLEMDTDSAHLIDLMNEYHRSDEAYKKLLILNVLTGQITDTVFSFITNEWSTTSNATIKKIIISKLPLAIHSQLPLAWFEGHTDVLEKNMTRIINDFSHAEYNEVYSRLIEMALDKGWQPASTLPGQHKDAASGVEPVLYNVLFYNKYERTFHDSIKLKWAIACTRIEDALLKHPQLNKEWMTYKNSKIEYPLPPDFVKQHQELTADYLRQSRKLLAQHQIDTAIYNDFIKNMDYPVKQLQEKKIRKKE